MANNILTPQMITRKALLYFHTNCVTVRNANRQYDKRFANKGAKIGDTLEVRLPNKHVVYDGRVFAGGGTQPDLNERSVPLVVTSRKHVPLRFTDEELTMSLDDFSERIIEPAVATLAAVVDADVYRRTYQRIAQSVGSPGTTPSTSLSILQCGEKLNNNLVPQNKRALTVNPSANVQLVEGMKGLFHASDPIEYQFKQGHIAKNMLGFQTIDMSQNVARHLNGVHGSGPHSVTVAPAEGGSQMTIGGFANSTTAAVRVGDVFTVAGVYLVNAETKEPTTQLMEFVVTATANSGGTGATVVNFLPEVYASGALKNVDSLPAASDVVTWTGNSNTAYAQNLAYYKDDLIFATADLEMPKGVDMAAREVMDGVSMRLVRDFDPIQSDFITRLDVLYGTVFARPEAGVRLWGE